MLKHDPAEPACERSRLAQHAQIPIGLDERLLRRVFGEMEVAKDRVRIPIRHVLEPAYDLGIRVQVACLRTGDEQCQFFHINFLLMGGLCGVSPGS